MSADAISRQESPKIDPVRGIFCNRTLNLNSIKAIGYDMDYTLVHYHSDAWEERAYAHMKRRLAAAGWPVEELSYDHDFIVRGLILDTELGNIVKANRFGYVKHACHGTRFLPFAEQRDIYGRTVVELGTGRFLFLNTLFSLSEACMFAQLVDLLDEGRLPDALGYEELWRRVHRALDEAHTEGELKGEILARPEAYIEQDPGTALALLDQKHAGKKLALITNSDWAYTLPIMNGTLDAHLPEGMGWRDLFDLVIVSARKPSFFDDANPAFEVVNDEGLLKPAAAFEEGKAYVGGNAAMLEALWGLSDEELLYVGDHIYADVAVSKKSLHWRTALVVREVEEELEALTSFEEDQRRLGTLMREKERLEHEMNQLRLAAQRRREGYGEPEQEPDREPKERQRELRQSWEDLDKKIAPLARASSALANSNWGLLMRAGNDKSYLARRVENYSDIYLSRVSNFLQLTPFSYLRSPRSSLPHDSLGVHATLQGME